MVVIEAVSPDAVETTMKHHPSKNVILTYFGRDTVRRVVGLGWYTPETISGVSKGLLRWVGNPP